jgi:GTP-binding protein
MAVAFVDECSVQVTAGRGGDGSSSLHSEPFKPRGGPDGGNGGPGGSVIFEVAGGVHDLSWLGDHPHQTAKPGAPGRSSRRDGAAGADLVLPVPDGTVVFDEEGLIADLVGDGARAVIARGGRGGRGSAALAGPKNRVPRGIEPGEEGEAKRIRVELRTVADVGLVGLPNAGKSTLLSRLTAATPKIADYPFTTLTPNLGVADVEDDRVVVADVPGLIEGAHEGRGLGHRFLRHVVRCRALVLAVDLSTEDPSSDLAVLRSELASFDPELAARPAVVVATKADLVEDPAGAGAALDPAALVVSALSGDGMDALRSRLGLLSADAAAAAPERTSHVVLRPGRARFTVTRHDSGPWTVRGPGVERWVRDTDLEDEHALEELQRRLKREGVFRRLLALGARSGDDVEISGRVFIYVPDEDAR